MSCSGSETGVWQDNQHNNGPHQDQIFDNPSALCIGFGGGGGGGGGTDTPNRLFRKGVRLSVSPFNFLKFLSIRFTLFMVFQI